MSANDSKTVWVLGSGFSRSLGGPLLVDLFRMKAYGDDELQYPNGLFPRLATDLFETRVMFGAGLREGLWQNAEEFLAYLDEAFAVSDSRRKKILESLASRTPHRGTGDTRPQNLGALIPSRKAFLDEGNTLARRCLAAECSSFLDELDPDDERWAPYEGWILTLNPELDTIISFNYDRVLDLADVHLQARPGGRSRLATLLPQECVDGPQERVPVLKLHGSVDWLLKGKLCERVEPGVALMSEQARVAIAAPGRSKAKWVGGYLAPLWQQAKKALQSAGNIVLAGYSMPSTDAMARIELLTAIREDKSGEQHRRVDIVMGPDTSRGDVRRVGSLLEACRKGRKLVVSPERPPHLCASQERLFYLATQPLGAEDFIADYVDRLRDWAPVAAS
jgi:hypothetical protein